MSAWVTGTAGPLRWAAAGRAANGEIASGDRHVVCATADGALVAVIDGLGHGVEAAEAATRAAELVARCAESADLVHIFRVCHDALARSRGVVMSLAHFRADTLRWLAVGNVEAVVVRGPRAGASRRQRFGGAGGVVGHALPPLHPSLSPTYPGDLVVLATDGLRASALDDVGVLEAPEALARSLLARHADGRDDALVLAARIGGAAP